MVLSPPEPPQVKRRGVAIVVETHAGHLVTPPHDAEHSEATDHGLVHHYFDDADQQREAHSLGMWSFLVTEVMMFGGLFFAYTLYRGMFHAAFVQGSRSLDTALGTGNTFVLLFSSLTMAMAVHSAQERNRKALVGYLIATIILGASFLGIKAVEWTKDYNEGLVPVLSWHPEEWHEKGTAETGAAASAPGQTPYSAHVGDVHGMAPDVTRSGVSGNVSEEMPAEAGQAAGGAATNHVMMYFILYFCMAGLHAIHMIIGLAIVGTMTWMAHKGRFTNGNDQPIEIIGLYWHFIDIVWVFLFPLLYLVGGFHPGGH